MIEIPRDAYKGRRCFVVASGPSIKSMDLSVLKDEIVICVNESYKVLDRHPDFICIGDKALWPLVKEQYAKMTSSIICTGGTDNTCGTDYDGSNLKAVIPLMRSKEIAKDGFSFDLTKSLYKGWNVITEVVLPFVCWCGFTECFLVGCDCSDHGYAYEGSARGLNHQRFDKRAKGAYEHIASIMPLLPTKIYNATIGGHLEAFERRDFDSLFKSKILVVGYYTPDRNYKELARKMRQSVWNQGLDCVIKERPSITTKYGINLPKPLPWVLNCAQCGPFILEMMESHPNRPILYLDADASMVRPPVLLDTLDVDFAAPFLHNQFVQNELQSNTLYFAPTKVAKELVCRWKAEQSIRNAKALHGDYPSPYKAAWDQRVLQDVLEQMMHSGSIKISKLPWTYGKLDLTANGTELMPGVDYKDVVIQQHQASRQNKRKV